MTAQELLQFHDFLKSHYPNATEGDFDLVDEAMIALAPSEARELIRNIRRDEKTPYRPNVPAIRERIAAGSRRGTSSNAEKIATFIRRSTQGRFVGKINLDTILGHFTESHNAILAAVGGDVSHLGYGPARSLIRGHCSTALRQIGFSAEDAWELASGVVGMKPDERGYAPSQFIAGVLPALEPLKTSREAARELATAAGGAQ